jgi:glycerol-3-phosphate dehydrogenase subunit B
MLDLIVIGAGLTGLMAAYAAAKAGLEVKVIAKGLGALHWSAGTVDVLGYYPDESTPVVLPLQTIQELIKARPQHPYALLDETELIEALSSFVALTQEIGLPYGWRHGAGRVALRIDQENLLLPSPVGAARPTFLAPQAQLPGDLGSIARSVSLYDAPMLIVGFRGMRDFFPELIAANLNKVYSTESTHPSSLDTRRSTFARAAFLPLDLITDRRDSNTAQLAAELDNPARRAALAAELKKLVQPGEPLRVGLPAILGLDEHATVMQELQAQTGAILFEIPTLPPSVPGIRLNTALRREVERLGVRVEVNMDVIGFHTENGRVMWVETETSARPLKHRAANFMLATGGILGGGINADHTGKTWEVVLNLPVAGPQRRGEWFHPRFFDPAGHPIFRDGVPVNRQFQPVDASGSPVYSNVFAAGSLLAYADPILERSLEGIVIATGIAAAQHIARKT